ncbi:hypothetical protein D3C86_1623960 [compost metagenome]
MCSRHITLQQRDTTFRALPPPCCFRPILSGCNQAGLPLTTLLQKAVVFTARHQTAIQQGLGLGQLGL